MVMKLTVVAYLSQRRSSGTGGGALPPAQLENVQNDQTITIYLNSPGTNSPDGKAFSFDTEAFAIADTMQFIRPPIRTICVGQAYGTAAMILSLGQKGNRFALPNASIMLNQPRSRARGQASDVAIKAKEIMEAVQYGLIDKVLYPEELRKEVRHNAYSTLGGELSFTIWSSRLFLCRRQSSWTFCKAQPGQELSTICNQHD
jgi:hypothetical protein